MMSKSNFDELNIQVYFYHTNLIFTLKSNFQSLLQLNLIYKYFYVIRFFTSKNRKQYYYHLILGVLVYRDQGGV